MMEEKKSFLGKVFSSVVKRKEQEEAVAGSADSPDAKEGEETSVEAKPQDDSIPEEEVKSDFPDAAKTKQETRKMLSELCADPCNAKIIDVLKTIEDPEINIDIWTLELIYDITHRDDGGVEVLMTFTSPMCPFGPQLMQMVKDRIEEAGIKPVDVKVTFSPAWKPSEEVREMLGV